MGIVFTWFLFSIIAGVVGSDRKIGFWGAFLLSLLLSPLIGFIFAFASKRKSTIEFEQRMMQQSERPASNYRAGLADELAALERKYLDGKITVYDYENQKDNILRRYK